MFKNNISLEMFREMSKGTLSEHLGIEFVEQGEDYLIAKMPVVKHNQQPFGILHGGASVVLAETLGSIASVLCVDNPKKQKAVGLEINANHIRAVSSGWVYGKVSPIHIGRRTHVWEIKISNEEDKLVCISRLTVAIIE